MHLPRHPVTGLSFNAFLAPASHTSAASHIVVRQSFYFILMLMAHILGRRNSYPHCQCHDLFRHECGEADGKLAAVTTEWRAVVPAGEAARRAGSGGGRRAK